MLENKSVNIKIKLAGLWLTIFLLFIYGDLLPMWIPGHLKELLNGDVGAGPAMQLLGIAIYITVYALMPLLNLILTAKVSRIVNIVASVLLIAFWIFILINFSFSQMWHFYIYLAVVEMVISLIIIYVSWNWPVLEEQNVEASAHVRRKSAG